MNLHTIYLSGTVYFEFVCTYSLCVHVLYLLDPVGFERSKTFDDLLSKMDPAWPHVVHKWCVYSCGTNAVQPDPCHFKVAGILEKISTHCFNSIEMRIQTNTFQTDPCCQCCVKVAGMLGKEAHIFFLNANTNN